MMRAVDISDQPLLSEIALIIQRHVRNQIKIRRPQQADAVFDQTGAGPPPPGGLWCPRAGPPPPPPAGEHYVWPEGELVPCRPRPRTPGRGRNYAPLPPVLGRARGPDFRSPVPGAWAGQAPGHSSGSAGRGRAAGVTLRIPAPHHQAHPVNPKGRRRLCGGRGESGPQVAAGDWSLPFAGRGHGSGSAHGRLTSLRAGGGAARPPPAPRRSLQISGAGGARHLGRCEAVGRRRLRRLPLRSEKRRQEPPPPGKLRGGCDGQAGTTPSLAQPLAPKPSPALLVPQRPQPSLALHPSASNAALPCSPLARAQSSLALYPSAPRPALPCTFAPTQACSPYPLTPRSVWTTMLLTFPLEVLRLSYLHPPPHSSHLNF
ncbi:basic salivary proline-rich protein 3-like [Vombatus ursinus]|uniref:basic salivary proline-rich protein 3-like n=1 Tax=Vombatus ursinus TaxID=29139 RepID=UPI000FFD43B7|nr:basic salivary proline-rich protein 3-like [Vombatus ursinus]